MSDIRFIKFITNALNSKNERVRLLAKSCTFNTLSITGSNIANIMCEYNVNNEDLLNNNAISKMNMIYNDSCAIPEEQWKINMMKELIDTISGLNHCGFNKEHAVAAVSRAHSYMQNNAGVNLYITYIFLSLFTHASPIFNWNVYLQVRINDIYYYLLLCKLQIIQYVEEIVELQRANFGVNVEVRHI